MLEKNKKLFVLPLLLSAALTLSACSTLSEPAGEDLNTPLLGTESPSEKNEEASKSEHESAAEEKEETADAEKTTTTAKKETDTQPKETFGSSENTSLSSETALGATEAQPTEISETKPVSESVSETTAAPPSTTTSPPQTPAPTEAVTAPPVSVTENTPPPVMEPVPTETASDIISDTQPVSEPISETNSEPVTDTPPSPALTGGRYDQRYCTEKETEFADRVFELTNAERAKNGLPAFEKMDTLKTVALTRAWELTVEYRADHTRPDGTTCTGAFNENGIIYGGWGENIAAGQDSPESVVEAWMNSPSHRAAILSDDYAYMGVGYYYIEDDYQSYYHFWTQEFYHY